MIYCPSTQRLSIDHPGSTPKTESSMIVSMLGYNLLGYLIFALTMAITPGPNNLLLFSTGKSFGLRPALPTMLGILTGFFCLLTFSGYGMSALLLKYPNIYTLLRIVSSGWLLYLAWLIRKMSNLEESDSPPIGFKEAALMQFINPKVWIMAMNGAAAFMPQTNNIHLNVLVFAAIFVGVGLPCTFFWVLTGEGLAKVFRSPRWQPIISNTLALMMVLTVLTLWI